MTDSRKPDFKEGGKAGVTVKLSEDVARRLGLIGWEGMAKWRT